MGKMLSWRSLDEQYYYKSCKPKTLKSGVYQPFVCCGAEYENPRIKDTLTNKKGVLVIKGQFGNPYTTEKDSLVHVQTRAGTLSIHLVTKHDGFPGTVLRFPF